LGVADLVRALVASGRAFDVFNLGACEFVGETEAVMLRVLLKVTDKGLRLGRVRLLRRWLASSALHRRVGVLQLLDPDETTVLFDWNEGLRPRREEGCSRSRLTGRECAPRPRLLTPSSGPS
jgi:hypothetical protein